MTVSTKKHCCDTMEQKIDPKCDIHENPWDCEDAMVVYEPEFDSYAFMSRFDAGFMISMHFCPWCGDKKRDLSDQYYELLDEMGVKEYEAKYIPKEFQSDAWWKERGL